MDESVVNMPAGNPSPSWLPGVGPEPEQEPEPEGRAGWFDVIAGNPAVLGGLFALFALVVVIALLSMRV